MFVLVKMEGGLYRMNDYYMPPEWEMHDRTFVSWPVKESMVWPENYDNVCKAYGEIINAIALFEKVNVIVNKDQSKEVRKFCGNSPSLLEIPHNDAWVRDNGPTFLTNKNDYMGINWRFNAWGEKYKPYDLDDAVAFEILNKLRIQYKNAPFVLEGGSIHVDGEGTLLTTEECLLNKNRNPHLDKDKIIEYLKKYLNISHIIWLEKGLYGDETDGHVDNIACFARPGAVLLQTCKDKNDPNYKITNSAFKVLSQAKDAKGRQIQIIEIPLPPARYDKGSRLTLSYLNFYFVNGGIILPVFGGEAEDTDKEAQRVLKLLYPERIIHTVDGMGLISEGGNVHCITQQMPSLGCGM